MAQRIRLTFGTDLQRRRLVVLFRVLLAALPALVIAGWTALVVVTLVMAWLSAATRGELPDRLHEFERRYVFNLARLVAWFALVSPRDGVSLEAPRSRQPRATVVFRPLLALPAVVLASVLAVALAWSAVAAWFVAVARGRTTEGLRELGAFCIRYHAEVVAYLLLLTPRAPRLTPPS